MSKEYVVEYDQPFAQSMLWDLQSEYFQVTGPDAWRNKEVPHYITSNPFIAERYAELILALFRDQSQAGRETERVRILELGGGTGKLAFNILRCLERLCESAPFPIPPYTYLLTDLSETNVAYWRSHPRFQPYFENGALEIARLDALAPIESQAKAGSELSQLQAGPVVVVANYFFDSIPQDLFRIQNGQIEACHTTLISPLNPETAPVADLLKAIKPCYHYHPLDQLPYQNEELNRLLQGYRVQFVDSHLLFPHTGLQLLQNLLKNAPKGLLLLSADKGEHRLDDLRGRSVPHISRHGSFSLQVNYHALQSFCQGRNGIPLSTSGAHYDLDLHCMLFFPENEQLRELQFTFNQRVQAFGPDQFFGIKRALQRHANQLTVREILPAVELSRYDPRLFSQLLPRLEQLAGDMSTEEACALLQMAIRVWDNHFPLDEKDGLARQIGNLLLELGFVKEANRFYELSLQLQVGPLSVVPVA